MQQLDRKDLADTVRARCLGSRVARPQRQVGRRFDQALASYGLTMAQLELLTALETIGAPIAPSMLASALGVERSTMSRNLALLEERELVCVAERTPSGRARTVAVTEAGSEHLAASGEAWSAVQREIECALGADSPEQFDRWLQALTSSASAPRSE